MSNGHAETERFVTNDPEIVAIADRLFELVIRFRPPRPPHHDRDGNQEEYRQRHGQMRMLITLFHEGPLTGQDLARALDVSAPTASVLAKRAFEEGWIERRRDEGDSRIVWLELAPAGRERVQAHRAERVRKLQRMIAQRTDLDRREIAQAVDVLTRLFTPLPAGHVCNQGSSASERQPDEHHRHRRGHDGQRGEGRP
ncbi:MAG: MarR family transcriptional regulator [Thermomicrobiales bacterium]